MNKISSARRRILMHCALISLAQIALVASAELPSESNSPEKNAAIVAAIQKSYEGATRVVSGSKSPDEIPQRVKLAQLVRYYDSDHQSLSAILSPEDDAILRAASENDKYARKERLLWYKQSYANICSTMTEIDGHELAKRVEPIVLESQARNLQLYQDSINKLSPTGSQAVMDYVETSITPGLTVTLVDSLKVAEQHPDLFKLKMEHRCHYYLTGSPHPDVQAGFDASGQNPDADASIIHETSSGSSYTAEFD